MAMNKNREEYEDALLKMFIHEVMQEKSREYMEEAAYAPLLIPEEIDRAAEKLIGKPKKKGGFCLAFAKRVVVAASFLFLMLCGIATTAFAMHEEISQLWTLMQMKNAEIEMSDSESRTRWFSVFDYYIPGVVPQGFAAEEISFADGDILVHYRHTENEEDYIRFFATTGNKSAFISEKFADRLKLIEFNGAMGLVTEDGNTKTLVWLMDDVLFCIESTLSEEENCMIAASIRTAEE